jgi:hypothetical protein
MLTVLRLHHLAIIGIATLLLPVACLTPPPKAKDDDGHRRSYPPASGSCSSRDHEGDGCVVSGYCDEPRGQHWQYA